MKLFRIPLLLGLALLAPRLAAAQNAEADNMRILREKMMGDKKLIVAANMALTDAESKAFWPIYDAYQAELQKINEQLGTIIADYARMHNAGKLTDARARALMDRYLGAEEAEVRLKRTCAKRLDKVLPGVKVTRYLQIENKILAIVNYELAGYVQKAK